MYLSGAPLHVITLTLAGEYRRAVGSAVPISFSAGVDRKNFFQLVQCGFAPITTCTDLLKTGGYGRLPPYLLELRKDMQRVGATTYCRLHPRLPVGTRSNACIRSRRAC